MDIRGQISTVLRESYGNCTEEVIDSISMIINHVIEENNRLRSIDFNARTMALEIAAKTGSENILEDAIKYRRFLLNESTVTPINKAQ